MNRLNEGKDARAFALRVQRFNESAGRADQNIEMRSSIIAVAQCATTKRIQDCGRAFAASR
jgi:hypothetical protein